MLFGLKYGLVTSMLTALAEDPENRELKPLGSGHYTAVWFRGMRARPEVAFVSPRTRTLAATLELSSKTASVILPAELIPSGQHDPLLEGLQRRPAGLHEVVLSRSAAERLKVAKGALIQASLSRQYQARHERVRLDLRVVDVASERAFARPAVFASLEVLMAADAFRDGRAGGPAGLRACHGGMNHAMPIPDQKPSLGHRSPRGSRPGPPSPWYPGYAESQGNMSQKKCDIVNKPKPIEAVIIRKDGHIR